MSSQHRSLRTASMTLLGLLLFGVVAAPVAMASSDIATCRVHNVTQDTVGTSFKAVVAAAHDGDRLRVRGTCRGGVTIDKDLTIRGRGDETVLTGRRRDRVIAIGSNATVVLRQLVIGAGSAPGHEFYVECGGGIWNLGTLTMIDSVVRNSLGGCGGGIWNEGTVSLVRSMIVRNSGADGGGGIRNKGTMTLLDSAVRKNHGGWYEGYGGGGIDNWGTLTVTNSSVVGNMGVDGGGIGNHGSLRLVNSVVRDNTAQGSGGGVDNFGDLVLEGSTVTANTAAWYGGGIWNDADAAIGGTVTLDSTSSVTGNTPDDCYGTTAC